LSTTPEREGVRSSCVKHIEKLIAGGGLGILTKINHINIEEGLLHMEGYEVEGRLLDGSFPGREPGAGAGPDSF